MVVARPYCSPGFRRALLVEALSYISKFAWHPGLMNST